MLCCLLFVVCCLLSRFLCCVVVQRVKHMPHKQTVKFTFWFYIRLLIVTHCVHIGTHVYKGRCMLRKPIVYVGIAGVDVMNGGGGVWTCRAGEGVPTYI